MHLVHNYLAEKFRRHLSYLISLFPVVEVDVYKICGCLIDMDYAMPFVLLLFRNPLMKFALN